MKYYIGTLAGACEKYITHVRISHRCKEVEVENLNKIESFLDTVDDILEALRDNLLIYYAVNQDNGRFILFSNSENDSTLFKVKYGI